MKTDPQSPVDLLREMVQIQSHDSVDEIREYLLESIDGAKLHSSGCVVAEKGDSGGFHTVLNTHMDTVPPHIEYGYDADSGVVRGRGSCDAKASLAAMVSAFSRADPEDGRVTLVVSPDEETDSVGLYDYLEDVSLDADLCVVGEPTNLDVCTAARGRYEVIADFFGEAAHAAAPESGLNAVSCVAEAVRRLEATQQKYDDLLGESSLTVTQIDGGEAKNQVPENASLFIDRRSVPPETQDKFLEEVDREMKGIDCDYEVRFSERPTPFLDAFRTDEDDVERLVDAVEEATGESRLRPFDAATEASYLAKEMPVAVFGPGSISETDEDGNEVAVAHSEREYVETDEVVTATRVLSRLLD
ncbi:M20 family metallopeptidase [Halorutilales archaeon Cl-col2-1]